jgi:UPF0042 nucleotide-binding protein
MKTPRTPVRRSRKAAAPPRPVLLVTGLSGAGLSTALKTLEDLGYQAVDNLPLSLLPTLVAEKKGADRPLAVGIDSRTWDFSARSLIAHAEALRRKKDVLLSLVYIDCQDIELQRRFTETRRVHPLAIDRPVSDGVARDRARTARVRAAADVVIDTTAATARDLKRIIAGHFTLSRDRGLQVFVTSFGFKHGLPRDADYVFDMRFLDNPYWHRHLKKLSGRDRAVTAHIRGDAAYGAFFAQMTGMLGVVLPRFAADGRHYLTVAIGCTGGRHRSVFAAEEIFGWLGAQGYSAGLRHRDIDRDHAAAEEAAAEKKEA